MEDEKISMEYSLKDLNRRDIRALISYVDITNRLLKIIIPILGIESCRSILTNLCSDYEILRDIKITNNMVMGFSTKVIETLEELDEYTGLVLVSSAFYNIISNIMEVYTSMSSPQLGVVALITAASETANERLKEIEKSKVELEKANAKLEEWAKTLEEKVEEKTRQLKQTEAQLFQSAKMSTIGQLAAGVAHELNNPIGGILGYAQFILQKLSNPEFTAEDFKSCSRYVKYIEEESKRCKAIVENLLLFSRKPMAAAEPVDIKEAIERTLLIIRHNLELQNIRLTTDYEPGLPPIPGNFNQLQQVFINLILNAQQAMPHGGELNICVKSKVEETKKSLVITFKDTGCGIPKENLERIFEPFFTTKQDGKSLGIGLFITYQIIQEHKGSITVESEEGKGATFTITLPC